MKRYGWPLDLLIPLRQPASGGEIFFVFVSQRHRQDTRRAQCTAMIDGLKLSQNKEMHFPGDGNLKKAPSDDEFQKIFSTVLNRPNAGVDVLVAPPGFGKSVMSRRAIALLLQQERVKRVIWLTHSTINQPTRASMAEEARQHFEDLGVPTQVIHGVAHFTRRNETAVQVKVEQKLTFRQQYEAQFSWPEGPQVKLMSYAHLPALYGKKRRQKVKSETGQRALGQKKRYLRDLPPAELLVIDEDPSSALITTFPRAGRDMKRNPLTYMSLVQTASSELDPLSHALLNVMNSVLQVPEPFKYQKVRRRGGGYNWSYTGKAFFQALRAELGDTPVNWQAFQRNMPFEDHWLARIFAEELAGKEGGHNFGLQWETCAGRGGDGAEQIQRTMTFRYDVLMPLRGLPPTVVLDAYGDSCSGYYEAMFSRPVTFPKIDVGERPTIMAAGAPHFKLSRRAAVQKKSRRVDYVIQEIIDFTLQQTAHNTLVLCYKDMIPALQKALERAPEGARVNVQFQHWFAGRGSNNFRNYHIIALVPPHRPRRFQQHTLAALFPRDETTRTELAKVLDDTELVQMLHRNRQVNHPAVAGHPDAPKVVLGFPLPQGLETHVQLRPLGEVTPNSRYSTRTSTHEWHALVQGAATELSDMLGAVPIIAFMALGLTETPEKYRPMISHVRQRLRGKIRTSRYQELSAWKQNPTYFEDRLPNGLQRRSDDSATLARSFQRLLVERKYSLCTPSGSLKKSKIRVVYLQYLHQLRVWAADQEAADQVLVRLLN